MSNKFNKTNTLQRSYVNSGFILTNSLFFCSALSTIYFKRKTNIVFCYQQQSRPGNLTINNRKKPTYLFTVLLSSQKSKEKLLMTKKGKIDNREKKEKKNLESCIINLAVNHINLRLLVPSPEPWFLPWLVCSVNWCHLVNPCGCQFDAQSGHMPGQ